MIDLNQAFNEMYSIKWLDGNILYLKKPTRAMEMTFLSFKKDLNEDTAQKLFYNLMYRIFERREPITINKKGFFNRIRNKKEVLQITEEDIEKIPFTALLQVCEEYFDFYYKRLGE